MPDEVRTKEEASSADDVTGLDEKGKPGLLRRIAASKWFTITMFIVTFFALFGDDIRVAAFSPAADPVFYALSAAALVLFTLEIILNIITKDDYLWKFYFWLDILGTLSLIPDIGWIWELITGDSGTSSGAQQATRASRAGARAGRVVRIVRLIRLIRIVKLFKHAEDRRNTGTSELDDEPTKVGRKLSDLTTRRVIMLVLSMLIVQPVFDLSTFQSQATSQHAVGFSSLHMLGFPHVANQSDNFARNLVQDYLREEGMDAMLNMTLYGQPAAVIDSWVRESLPEAELMPVKDLPAHFRDTEIDIVTQEVCYDEEGLIEGETCTSTAYFSTKEEAVAEALLNLGKTLTVMVTLALAALLFTRDADRLVIKPVSRMVGTVKSMAADPIASLYVADSDSDASDENGTHEMALLENTIQKVGNLLQIGFGAAGSRIIAQNLQAGEFNPMVKGAKVHAIFGFCDIRQFTDATECLQEGVMVFVNQIGEIVHGATHEFGGTANKNIGDAFLLVWRLPDEDNPAAGKQGLKDAVTALVANPMGQKNSPTPDALEIEMEEYKGSDPGQLVTRTGSSVNVESLEEDVQQLHDNALMSFIRIIVDVEESNRNGVLKTYAENQRIRSRFPNGYSVRMGFGLHTGWAIEGAIGSTYKIDASYLSPNVNIASRLEAATKQYGVPLLLSEAFVQYLSPAARSYIRLVDRVTVKGSELPIRLYTFDINYITPIGKKPKSGKRIDADFVNNAKIPLLQKGIAPNFFQMFNRGVDAYLSGRWVEAKDYLLQAARLKPGDGPCRTLLLYMDTYAFEAPNNWKGYRPLLEK